MSSKGKKHKKIDMTGWETVTKTEKNNEAATRIDPEKVSGFFEKIETMGYTGKVKYVNKNSQKANALILFSFLWGGALCAPVLLFGDGDTLIFGFGMLFICLSMFMTGIILSTNPGVTKRKKKLMKDDRNAITAYVTKVVKKALPIRSEQRIICKSEQTGLEYISDSAFYNFKGYEGTEVWVYLDPDDQSEYGEYFVDLEGMVQKYFA
ncbi:MAG: hypothetical protein FWG90_08900 [Oscillospiraceae bacterium]|nr:hypothetical protein [Oscillospiraceae bacterium]